MNTALPLDARDAATVVREIDDFGLLNPNLS